VIFIIVGQCALVDVEEAGSTFNHRQGFYHYLVFFEKIIDNNPNSLPCLSFTMGPESLWESYVSRFFLLSLLFEAWNGAGSCRFNGNCNSLEFEPLTFHGICNMLALELFMLDGILQLGFI